MKRIAGLAWLLTVSVLGLAPAATAVAVDADLPAPLAPEGAALVSVEAAAEHDANASVTLRPSPPRATYPDRPQTQGMAAIPMGERSGPGLAVGAAIGLALVAVFWSTIKGWLLGTALLPFFSRIDANKILENEVRNRVHEAILQNPGITIKEISQTLGIGWGTTIYHLKRLEAERLIVSERHRQFRRYFKNGGGIVNEDKAAFSELKNPTTQRLASAVLERPGLGQKELCEALGISAPLAHKYLGRMEEAQLLTKHREWKSVKYFPTERLAEMLAPTAVAVAA